VVEEAGVPDEIHHDLKELDEWSKKWLMSFNPDKTEIMLFSNTDIPEFNNTFNGRTIPITNSHKHLGVTFSTASSTTRTGCHDIAEILLKVSLKHQKSINQILL
jgi:hypothetical protein